MQLIVDTPPSAAVLTATEVRDRTGIAASVVDGVLDTLIAAATQTLDGYSGWLARALITQTWDMVLPGFYLHHMTDRHYRTSEMFHRSVVSGGIRIPLPPLQAIVSIKYYDVAGTLQTLDPASYRVVPGTFAVVFPVTSWPTTQIRSDAVTIQFRCGYGDAGTDVPEPIRQAIALQVSYLSLVSGQKIFTALDRVEGVGEKRYLFAGVPQIMNSAIEALIGNYRMTI